MSAENQTIKSDFASPDRTGQSEIERENQLIRSLRDLVMGFDLVSGVAAVLNDNRQIIYVNEEFLSFTEGIDIEAILGKRPGEVVNCVHSWENVNGCGTSLACASCGAVRAIIEAQKTKATATAEATIMITRKGRLDALELFVVVKPLKYDEKWFYVATLKDISSEKRKRNLERVFFHDIINTAGALNGVVSIIQSTADEDKRTHLLDLTERYSRFLLDDILSFQQLALAETGELNVIPKTVSSVEVLREVSGMMHHHKSARNKIVQLDPASEDFQVETDHSLLVRILINMLKNALEASADGRAVKIVSFKKGNRSRFEVWNDGVIAPELRPQIFHRNFSTKGGNRGVGTYSIRILVERYLTGWCGFSSDESSGTVFWVELPEHIS